MPVFCLWCCLFFCLFPCLFALKFIMCWSFLFHLIKLSWEIYDTLTHLNFFSFILLDLIMSPVLHSLLKYGLRTGQYCSICLTHFYRKLLITWPCFKFYSELHRSFFLCFLCRGTTLRFLHTYFISTVAGCLFKIKSCVYFCFLLVLSELM